MADRSEEGEGGIMHQGVLRGAEMFITSWHKKEEEESRKRQQDKQEQGKKQMTSKQGWGTQGGRREWRP